MTKTGSTEENGYNSCRGATRCDLEKLLKIHKGAAQLLSEPDLNHMKARLNRTRSKRIALAAELKRKQTLYHRKTVSHELFLRKERSQGYLPNYLRRFLDEKKQPYGDRNDRSVLDGAVDEHRLAYRMACIRLQRKLAAACRLSGISLLPCKEELIALRFDICLHGVYVNCFHTFFDLVSTKGGGARDIAAAVERNTNATREFPHENLQLSVRLVQHTLPASIPLGLILWETLGGVAHLGLSDDPSHWETGRLLGRIQKCAQRLYHACYCYSMRQQSIKFLEAKQERQSALSERLYYKTAMVRSSDTFDRIFFQIKLLSGACTLSVELAYKNTERLLPTVVSVKNVTSTKRRVAHHRGYRQPISDSEGSDSMSSVDDLVESSASIFRKYQIESALPVVVDAMIEW